MKLSNQNILASDDEAKLAIFEEEDGNKCLMLDYMKEENIVRASVMRGGDTLAYFDIEVRNDLLGRKYDGIIGLMHYFERILSKVTMKDAS